MINNNQVNKETGCDQNPKEKWTRQTEPHGIQIMEFSDTDHHSYFEKLKDKMKSVYREPETITMNQKKCTELKHYLSHKKQPEY